MEVRHLDKSKSLNRLGTYLNKHHGSDVLVLGEMNSTVHGRNCGCIQNPLSVHIIKAALCTRKHSKASLL